MRRATVRGIRRGAPVNIPNALQCSGAAECWKWWRTGLEARCCCALLTMADLKLSFSSAARKHLDGQLKLG